MVTACTVTPLFDALSAFHAAHPGRRAVAARRRLGPTHRACAQRGGGPRADRRGGDARGLGGLYGHQRAPGGRGPGRPSAGSAANASRWPTSPHTRWSACPRAPASARSSTAAARRAARGRTSRWRQARRAQSPTSRRRGLGVAILSASMVDDGPCAGSRSPTSTRPRCSRSSGENRRTRAPRTRAPLPHGIRIATGPDTGPRGSRPASGSASGPRAAASPDGTRSRPWAFSLSDGSGRRRPHRAHARRGRAAVVVGGVVGRRSSW